VVSQEKRKRKLKAEHLVARVLLGKNQVEHPNRIRGGNKPKTNDTRKGRGLATRKPAIW